MRMELFSYYCAGWKNLNQKYRTINFVNKEIAKFNQLKRMFINSKKNK